MSLPIPGECYWLPSEDGSHDDKGFRPHVVLSPESNNDAVVTLAFASSSGLQAQVFGAPHVSVSTLSPLFNVTGLHDDSYIYPSRLAVSLISEVPRRPEGRIVDEFPALRDEELPKATGLKVSPFSPIGASKSSRRGQIAVFSNWFADLLGTRHGLVISWPPYSAADQVQNIVPIFDASEYELVSPNLCISGEHWLKPLSPLTSALLMIDLVQSAYDGGESLPIEERDIIGYLETPVSAKTMSSVDEALSLRLFGVGLKQLALR